MDDNIPQQPNTNTRSKDKTPVFLGVSLGIISFCVSLFAIYYVTVSLNKITDEIRAIKDGMSVTEKTAAEEAPGDITEYDKSAFAGEIVKIGHGSFQFELPSGWSIDWTEAGTKALLFDENGGEAGNVYCPFPETGWELWNFESETRTITEGSAEHMVRLDIGTPSEEYPDVNPVNLLFMERNVNTEKAEGYIVVPAKNACAITGEGSADGYRVMYESVKILD